MPKRGNKNKNERDPQGNKQTTNNASDSEFSPLSLGHHHHATQSGSTSTMLSMRRCARLRFQVPGSNSLHININISINIIDPLTVRRREGRRGVFPVIPVIPSFL